MYEEMHYKLHVLMQTYVLTVGLILNNEELQNLTLLKVENILQKNRRTLKDFRPISYPNGYILEQLGNQLIYDERNYDVAQLIMEFANMFSSLTGSYISFSFLNLIFISECYVYVTSHHVFFNSITFSIIYLQSFASLIINLNISIIFIAVLFLCNCSFQLKLLAFFLEIPGYYCFKFPALHQ